MSKFALDEFNGIKGSVPFYKLRVNGICPIDEFWTEIQMQGNLDKQLNTAIATMESVAMDFKLPEKKYKNITPRGEKLNEYEVKTKDLRIYMFRNPSGAIVILGGKKSSQPRDINKFRNLKREYIDSIKL